MSETLLPDERSRIEMLRLLASRLERLSADSRWARRASGLRGNIVRVLEEAEAGTVSDRRLDLLIGRSFEILRAAAQEIPDVEALLGRSKRGAA
jgi:hypothetical protein